MKYFCYDPEDGFSYFNNRKDAIAKANKFLDFYRNQASDGWSENADGIKVGIITHETEEYVASTRPDDSELDEDSMTADGIYWDEGVDKLLDYSLNEVGDDK